MLAQIAKIKESINASQQVILGYMVIKGERVEEPVPQSTLLTHHG